MRNLLLMFVLIALLSGCTSEQNFTKETATNRVLNKVPKCGNNLETFNKVIESKENENGFVIRIQRDCEPKNGEGPQMRSTYKYNVTSNEVKILEANS
jgi:hypothetical protein